MYVGEHFVNGCAGSGGSNGGGWWGGSIDYNFHIMGKSDYNWNLRLNYKLMFVYALVKCILRTYNDGYLVYKCVCVLFKLHAPKSYIKRPH